MALCNRAQDRKKARITWGISFKISLGTTSECMERATSNLIGINIRPTV